MFALPESGIETPADLVGKKIAINTLQSASDFQIVAEMNHLGLEFTMDQFVEMPFPEMPAALEQGHVDAAKMAEPFMTRVQEELGAVPVLSSPTRFSAIPEMDNLPFGVFAALSEYIDERPEVVEGFQRAMERARLEVVADKQVGIDAFLNHSDMDRELAESLSWPDLEPASLADYERMAQLMDEAGYLQGEVDLENFLTFQ